MRLIFAAALAIVAAVAASPSARAQESDEEIKRRILDKVRERLADERKGILDRMSKIIDEELSGGGKKAAGPVDKRIRDIERKMLALDDQRDDLQRDLRGIKRETEDAKIIEKSKTVAKDLEDAVDAQDQEALQEAQKALSDSFNEYNDLHTAKEYGKSIEGFKRLYYGLSTVRTKQATAGIWIPAAYNVACGYALQGNKTEAIDWLEVAIKAGYKDWKHIREDGDFDSIRKERRYLRLLTDK